MTIFLVNLHSAVKHSVSGFGGETSTRLSQHHVNHTSSSCSSIKQAPTAARPRRRHPSIDRNIRAPSRHRWMSPTSKLGDTGRLQQWRSLPSYPPTPCKIRIATRSAGKDPSPVMSPSLEEQNRLTELRRSVGVCVRSEEQAWLWSWTPKSHTLSHFKSQVHRLLMENQCASDTPSALNRIYR